MYNRKKILILVISLSLFFLSVANLTNAQMSYGSPGWSIGNIAEFGLPGSSIGNIIKNIVFWLLGLFAFFGIIGFAVSGIMYLVSAGNDEMIGKAKTYMMYSIVGVIVGLMGVVILQAAAAMLSASSYF